MNFLKFPLVSLYNKKTLSRQIDFFQIHWGVSAIRWLRTRITGTARKVLAAAALLTEYCRTSREITQQEI